MAHRTRAILPTRRRSGGLSFWKAKLSGESAENRADGAGVEAFELEGKGDEFVRALGYALQHDALEDRHVVTEAGLSTATLLRLDVDPVQFALAAGGNERSTNSFCIHTAVLGSKSRIANLAQTPESPILILNEAEAESFEQENLLRLHYSRGLAWAFRQIAERQQLEVDLRRQIEEQVARSEGLVREIDKRLQADAELRRQFDEQVARSEELVRQIASYRVVLDERQQVEADLRRQIDEQVARSEDLVRQIATCRAALEERQQVEAELRSELMKLAGSGKAGR